MRKLNLIAVLLICLIYKSYSQCGTFINSQYDEFDKTTLNTGKVILQNDSPYKLKIDLRYVKNDKNAYTNYIRFSAYLTNQSDNTPDLNKDAYVHFLFEDGTAETLRGGDHVGYIFNSLIWLNPFDEESRKRQNTLFILRSKNLKAIRFLRGYEKIDYYLNTSEKSQIKDMFKCITE